MCSRIRGASFKTIVVFFCLLLCKWFDGHSQYAADKTRLHNPQLGHISWSLLRHCGNLSVAVVSHASSISEMFHRRMAKWDSLRNTLLLSKPIEK